MNRCGQLNEELTHLMRTMISSHPSSNPKLKPEGQFNWSQWGAEEDADKNPLELALPEGTWEEQYIEQAYTRKLQRQDFANDTVKGVPQAQAQA